MIDKRADRSAVSAAVGRVELLPYVVRSLDEYMCVLCDEMQDNAR